MNRRLAIAVAAGALSVVPIAVVGAHAAAPSPASTPCTPPAGRVVAPAGLLDPIVSTIPSTVLSPILSPVLSPIASALPTAITSALPTDIVSILPSDVTSILPTVLPSDVTSILPSILPSDVTSILPTALPTGLPTGLPTALPSTGLPSQLPTGSPTSAAPAPSATTSSTPSPSPCASNAPALGHLALVQPPRVKGTVRKHVGQRDRVAAGAVSPAASSVTFQWLRRAKPIAHATHPSYRLTKRDLGKRVRVLVAYHRAGYSDLSVTLTVVKRVLR